MQGDNSYSQRGEDQEQQSQWLASGYATSANDYASNVSYSSTSSGYPQPGEPYYVPQHPTAPNTMPMYQPNLQYSQFQMSPAPVYQSPPYMYGQTLPSVQSGGGWDPSTTNTHASSPHNVYYSGHGIADETPASMGHTTLPLQETLPSFAHPTVGSVRQSEAAESRRREAIKHTCDICGRGFTKRHNFDGHMNSHKGEKPYKCSHCTKGFARQFDCYRHERDFCPSRPGQAT